MISESEFKRDVDQFFDVHAIGRKSSFYVWGQGSDTLGLLGWCDPAQELAEVTAAKNWQRTCFDHGFGWIQGPIQYGGRGLSPHYEEIWANTCSEYLTPNGGPLAIGLKTIAPGILSHGQDVAKEKYLRPLHRGDMIACQLFSEPDAGSDVANIQTRASVDGSFWRVSGQKVWSSGAQFSELGVAICRTGESSQRNENFTAFLVDMSAPGVEVRPLRQMNGGFSFNEVFLDDVRIHDDCRLGAVGSGWSVTLEIMMRERASASEEGLGGGWSFAQLCGVLQHSARCLDPILRHELVEIFIQMKIAQCRSLFDQGDGAGTGISRTLAKLSMTMNMERVSTFLSDALGMNLVADSGRWGSFAWNELVLTVPGLRIAGGTDEIHRNTIAERALGLPKDRRAG